jgi:hypothetical protein
MLSHLRHVTRVRRCVHACINEHEAVPASSEGALKPATDTLVSVCGWITLISSEVASGVIWYHVSRARNRLGRPTSSTVLSAMVGLVLLHKCEDCWKLCYDICLVASIAGSAASSLYSFLLVQSVRNNHQSQQVDPTGWRRAGTVVPKPLRRSGLWDGIVGKGRWKPHVQSTQMQVASQCWLP